MEPGQFWMQYSCLSDLALSTSGINKSNGSELSLFKMGLVLL